MWMNRSDVEIAAESCAEHPVLGPATRFLKALMESVDEQSDGWPYWSAPSKASQALQELIKNNTGSFWSPWSSTGVTLEDVEKTLTPIKRMVTIQREKQKGYGNTFEFDVKSAWTKARGESQPKLF